MPKKQSFTATDIFSMRARKAAGTSITEIARECGCNHSTISRYLSGERRPFTKRKPSDVRKKPEPDPKPTRSTCCTAVLAAEARRLHGLGMGITGIGAKTGLPYRTIAEVIDG